MKGPAYPGRVAYTEGKAQQYQQRKSRKHSAEIRLVEGAFKGIPRGRVLDVPCGGGRITLFLAAKGYEMTSADLSEPMLAITRDNVRKAGLEIPVEHQDVEKLGYPNRSFDSIICFRLFHHFPNATIRRSVVAELCRVAEKFVIISYFSPYSFTSMKRRLRSAMGGRKSHKHHTPLKELRGYFELAGFRFVKNLAQFIFIHTLHVAVFEREGS